MDLIDHPLRWRAGRGCSAYSAQAAFRGHALQYESKVRRPIANGRPSFARIPEGPIPVDVAFPSPASARLVFPDAVQPTVDESRDDAHAQ